MARLRPSFRLRTLFLFVTLLSLGLAVLSRYRQLGLWAAQEHYAALQAGYSAVRAQKPDTPDWNAYWRQYWKWHSPLRMDREAIEAALPLWQDSLRHAQLRDHYVQAVHRPWLMFWPPPRANRLPSLPTDDRQLADWWESHFGQHVRDNMLSEAWGSSVNSDMNERQLEILNGVDYSSDLHFNAFLRLREIMPVDDGPPETRVNYFATPIGSQSPANPASTVEP